MIAAGIVWGDNPRFDLSRLSFGDAAAARGDETLSRMGDSAVLLRHPPRQAHGKTARTPSGTIVAFNGWIDNADEISRELSLPADSNVAALYGAATETWGIAAERRIVGDYAAIIIPADGVMQLSRAPWSKHGLFYTLANSCAVAASVPRVLFGLGLERSVDPARYAELLYGLAPSWGAQTYFDEVSQVEQGSVVTIDRGSVQKVQWYDPHALSATRLARDEDYVEQASALLADSVRHALGPAMRPGILLSGGLDSPLVAAEILDQLPEGRRLKSFTFVPLQEGNEPVLPAHFHSDGPAVEAFAALYPALDPQFIDNRGIAFGHMLDDTFRTSDAAYPSLIASEFRGPWQAASDAGCDWLFTADMGNQTFSCEGNWAFVEFLRTGRFGELMRLLRTVPGDDRPLWRRFAARSILPNLPAAIRSAVRTLVHGEMARPLVRKEVRERLDLDARYRAQYGEREWVRTRRDFVSDAWSMTSGGTEMTAAAEDLYGFRFRTIPQYRPLLEFCLTIPTDQYVRHGEQRYLARRMAIGRLPEAQRTNRRYGRHGVDWFERETPRLALMREEIERIADDPVMNAIIDVEGAMELLDNWPDRPDYRAKLEVFMPLAAAVVAGRFARYVDGRN